MLRRMKRQFLIDTDTASDDAVALIMALRHPEGEGVGITTVAGNVEGRQASRNALDTAEVGGARVAGASRGGEAPGGSVPRAGPGPGERWRGGAGGRGTRARASEE